MAICHPDGPDASGKIFEVAAGFIAEVRWERSKGAIFKTDATFTPSAVRSSIFTIPPFPDLWLRQVKAKWSELTDFKSLDYPVNMSDLDSFVSVRSK